METIEEKIMYFNSTYYFSTNDDGFITFLIALFQTKQLDTDS